MFHQCLVDCMYNIICLTDVDGRRCFQGGEDETCQSEYFCPQSKGPTLVPHIDNRGVQGMC